MKVLIVGKTFPDWHNGTRLYQEALRQNRQVDITELLASETKIYRDIRAMRPDFVLWTGMGMGRPSFWEQIKQVSRLAIWDADADNKKREIRWNAVTPIPDIIFTSVLGIREKYKHLNSWLMWIPQYHDQHYYKPTIDRLDPNYPSYDICFIGNENAREKRYGWLNKLREVFPNRNIIIRGSIDGFSRKIVQGTDAANLYRQSKIVIDIKRPGYKEMKFRTSDRLFKVMGCGAFFLTYPIEGVEKCFLPEKHFDFYDDTFEGLCEKIKYYLRYEKKRERIAAAGAEIIAAEHTITRRVEQYWELMEWKMEHETST